MLLPPILRGVTTAYTCHEAFAHLLRRFLYDCWPTCYQAVPHGVSQFYDLTNVSNLLRKSPLDLTTRREPYIAHHLRWLVR